MSTCLVLREKMIHVVFDGTRYEYREIAPLHSYARSWEQSCFGKQMEKESRWRAAAEAKAKYNGKATRENEKLQKSASQNRKKNAKCIYFNSPMRGER